jgi:MFS family permease
MLGLSLWLALVTHIDHGLHQYLLRHFGLSWPDLLHVQVWRLATATLVQPVPGLLWSNFLLLAMVLPLAELRIGSLRTIAAFFLGDWASTVPVLLILRIAAGLGNSAALHNLVSRDSGSSSAAFAVAGVLAMAVPHRTWRRVAVVVVFSWNVIPLIVHTRLFDGQHVLATAVGVVLALRWERRPAPRTVPVRTDEHPVPATV